MKNSPANLHPWCSIFYEFKFVKFIEPDFVFYVLVRIYQFVVLLIAIYVCRTYKKEHRSANSQDAAPPSIGKLLISSLCFEARLTIFNDCSARKMVIFSIYESGFVKILWTGFGNRANFRAHIGQFLMLGRACVQKEYQSHSKKNLQNLPKRGGC